MNLAHYYHVWADGDWETPLLEHLEVLAESGYDRLFHLGVVGAPERREDVLQTVEGFRRPLSVIVADSGYELVTLQAVWRYSQIYDGAVMYAHTKGAFRSYPEQEEHRRLLTDAVVRRWRENLELLGDHDAVGRYWLDEDRAGWKVGGFAGNFWIARCDYLRSLPDPNARIPFAWDAVPWEEEAGRGQAEVWIGVGDPHVAELVDWEEGDPSPVPGSHDVWESFRRRYAEEGPHDGWEALLGAIWFGPRGDGS